MKTLLCLLQCLFLAGVLAATGCDIVTTDDEDPKTCQDAVDNIWSRIEYASLDDTCYVLGKFVENYGIYWPSGTSYCGYFYVGSSYYYYYLPYESSFRQDMMNWCEDGYIADSYEGKWDQDDIDCNANAESVFELRTCWQ